MESLPLLPGLVSPWTMLVIIWSSVELVSIVLVIKSLFMSQLKFVALLSFWQCMLSPSETRRESRREVRRLEETWRPPMPAPAVKRVVLRNRIRIMGTEAAMMVTQGSATLHKSSRWMLSASFRKIRVSGSSYVGKGSGPWGKGNKTKAGHRTHKSDQSQFHGDSVHIL